MTVVFFWSPTVVYCVVIFIMTLPHLHVDYGLSHVSLCTVHYFGMGIETPVRVVKIGYVFMYLRVPACRVHKMGYRETLSLGDEIISRTDKTGVVNTCIFKHVGLFEFVFDSYSTMRLWWICVKSNETCTFGAFQPVHVHLQVVHVYLVFYLGVRIISAGVSSGTLNFCLYIYRHS